MTSLVERIKKATPDPKKPSLREWLISLDSEDTAAVTAMALDRAWSNAKLVEFLASEDVAANKDAVAAWRARCGFSR